jgi:hypothetical protein
MAQQEALGRLINAHYPALNSYVSLADAAGVTFFGYEVDGATVFTLTFSSDAAGSATSTPAVIDHYYGRSADTSGGVWHKTAVSPASNTFTAADATEDLVAIEVIASMCPDGKPYVKLNADGSGIVFAVLHDLNYQRTPANLRSITA